MPFKSEMQRRLFYAKAKRGEIPQETVEHWERETGGKKLPEKLGATTQALREGLGKFVEEAGFDSGHFFEHADPSTWRYLARRLGVLNKGPKADPMTLQRLGVPTQAFRELAAKHAPSGVEVAEIRNAGRKYPRRVVGEEGSVPVFRRRLPDIYSPEQLALLEDTRRQASIAGDAFINAKSEEESRSAFNALRPHLNLEQRVLDNPAIPRHSARRYARAQRQSIHSHPFHGHGSPKELREDREMAVDSLYGRGVRSIFARRNFDVDDFTPENITTPSMPDLSVFDDAPNLWHSILDPDSGVTGHVRLGQQEAKPGRAFWLKPKEASAKEVQHVFVTGAPGVGKTTAAQNLERSLGLPLVSLDGVDKRIGSSEALRFINKHLGDQPHIVEGAQILGFRNDYLKKHRVVLLEEDRETLVNRLVARGLSYKGGLLRGEGDRKKLDQHVGMFEGHVKKFKKRYPHTVVLKDLEKQAAARWVREVRRANPTKSTQMLQKMFRAEGHAAPSFYDPSSVSSSEREAMIASLRKRSRLPSLVSVERASPLWRQAMQDIRHGRMTPLEHGTGAREANEIVRRGPAARVDLPNRANTPEPAFDYLTNPRGANTRTLLSQRPTRQGFSLKERKRAFRRTVRAIEESKTVGLYANARGTNRTVEYSGRRNNPTVVEFDLPQSLASLDHRNHEYRVPRAWFQQFARNVQVGKPGEVHRPLKALEKQSVELPSSFTVRPMTEDDIGAFKLRHVSLKKPWDHTIVLNGKNLVGFAAYSPGERELKQLWVQPEYRRQGVATRLLSTFGPIDKLYVRAKNKGGQKFYRSQGLKVVGPAPGNWGGRPASLEMQKQAAYPREEAHQLAQQGLQDLNPLIDYGALTGSLPRWQGTPREHSEVNDIDLLVVPKPGQAPSLPAPYDVYRASPEDLESQAIHWGSGKAIIGLKAKAKAKGAKLTRYGLELPDGNVVRDADQIYAFLGEEMPEHVKGVVGGWRAKGADWKDDAKQYAPLAAGAGSAGLAGTLGAGVAMNKDAAAPLGPPPEPNRKEYPYQGTIDFQGIAILVENKKGTYRRGKSKDGTEWKNLMPAHYGEFKGSRGTDGDPLDVFVGPHDESTNVYIVHTKKPPTFTIYDEDKVMLGFTNAADAKATFLKAYDDKRFFGHMSACSIEDLKKLLAKRSTRGKKMDQELISEKAAEFTASVLSVANKVDALVRRFI